MRELEGPPWHASRSNHCNQRLIMNGENKSGADRPRTQNEQHEKCWLSLLSLLPFFSVFLFQRDVWPRASPPAAGVHGPRSDRRLVVLWKTWIYMLLPEWRDTSMILERSIDVGVSPRRGRHRCGNWGLPRNDSDLNDAGRESTWGCRNTSNVSEDLATATSLNPLLIPTILVKGFKIIFCFFCFICLRCWWFFFTVI